MGKKLKNLNFRAKVGIDFKIVLQIFLIQRFKTFAMSTLLMILSYSMDNAQPHKNVIYHQHNNSAKNPLKSVGSFTIVKSLLSETWFDLKEATQSKKL